MVHNRYRCVYPDTWGWFEMNMVCIMWLISCAKRVNWYYYNATTLVAVFVHLSTINRILITLSNNTVMWRNKMNYLFWMQYSVKLNDVLIESGSWINLLGRFHNSHRSKTTPKRFDFYVVEHVKETFKSTIKWKCKMKHVAK